MISLTRPKLRVSVNAALAKYQAEITAFPNFPDQISCAKRIWLVKRRSSTFAEVKNALRTMCSGAERCHYCEDSAADEIEHFRPKDIFPSYTFDWENFFYVCGPCNRRKGKKFAHFSLGPNLSTRIDLEKISFSSQPTGSPLFLNTCEDNPLKYLYLDLAGTFFFLPEERLDTDSHERASYTIEIFGLNRASLLEARKAAYDNYLARLDRYARKKEELSPDTTLNRIILGIQNSQHPSVWREIQRQHKKIEELACLFDQIPEAINW